MVRPLDNSKSEHREPIRTGINQRNFWADFLRCCRTRKQPISNAALSAPVNTTMQMGILALRGERLIRYDHEQRRVIA
ncbi:MAG: hypothetical protein ABIH23_11025 [bacterium]